MRDLRKHRRVPLTNDAATDTEKLRKVFNDGMRFGTEPRGTGRPLSWDEPTPLMGNPVLPELATS